MQSQIRDYIQAAVEQLKWQLPFPPEKIQVKQNKAEGHGDFSINIALQLAKSLGLPALEVATQLAERLSQVEEFAQVEVAGVGFINIFLQQSRRYAVVGHVLAKQGDYAKGRAQDKRVLVEFVSANPTGPLHVGHGRGAVYGDSLVRLLKKAGVQVEAEYYINDAGRQIEILTTSVLLRYAEKYQLISLELFNELYPSNAYQGDYIITIAESFAKLLSAEQKKVLAHIDYGQFLVDYREKFVEEDKEHYIDHLIAYLKKAIVHEDASLLLLNKKVTLDSILSDIKDDLSEMGIAYDTWFSEQSLVDDGSVDKTLARLNELGQSYQQDGATWFRSEKLGDDKDRVLVRQDGFNTYLAHDICYHQHKYERGYDQIINIWGADHHGYIARMRAAMTALDYDADKLSICLVQFANLFHGDEKVAMSTRSGEFISLRELRDEVGTDATRFFYNLNRADQHLNFDLQLAIEKSNDNPVFYVQYAYARIQSIFRRLKERGLEWQSEQSELSLLDDELELNLMRALSIYPQKIQDAAQKNAPHMITLYVRELAAQIHQYYNQSTILVEDEALRNARLDLLSASAMVIEDALGILGVSAPVQM